MASQPRRPIHFLQPTDSKYYRKILPTPPDLTRAAALELPRFLSLEGRISRQVVQPVGMVSMNSRDRPSFLNVFRPRPMVIVIHEAHYFLCWPPRRSAWGIPLARCYRFYMLGLTDSWGDLDRFWRDTRTTREAHADHPNRSGDPCHRIEAEASHLSIYPRAAERLSRLGGVPGRPVFA